MLSKNNFTGKFIVVYGPNNIGKTTQMRKIARRLLNQKNYIAYIKYPIYNLAPTGPIINEVLRQSQLSLGFEQDKYSMQIGKIIKKKVNPSNVEKEVQKLYAKNRRDFQEHLKGMLKAGMTVLAEDYVGTGIAWGMTRDVKLSFLEKINAHLLKPDIVILLDGDRFNSGKEVNHRNEDIENELWTKNRKIYQMLGQRYGWIKVNANGTIRNVHRRIWKKLNDNLEQLC